LKGNAYHAPDRSRFSGMNVIDMRMHMNFGDANNAFHNGKDSDDSYHDATYNVVYVDSHDYGPNKSGERYTGGTDSVALVTVSGSATYTGIPNGTYTDAVTGDTKVVSGGTLTVPAPGKGNLRVYVLDLGGKNAAPGKIGTAGPYLK
nr:alpha-amylase [Streptomyces sp. DSM 41633]